jgi:hypothetical protein
MSLQAGQKRGFEPNNEAESIKTDQVDNNTNVPHNGLSTAGAATNDEGNGDSEDQVLKRAKLSNTDNSTVPHHEPSAMIADEFKRTSAGIENAAKHGFDEGKFSIQGAFFGVKRGMNGDAQFNSSSNSRTTT